MACAPVASPMVDISWHRLPQPTEQGGWGASCMGIDTEFDLPCMVMGDTVDTRKAKAITAFARRGSCRHGIPSGRAPWDHG